MTREEIYNHAVNVSVASPECDIAIEICELEGRNPFDLNYSMRGPIANWKAVIYRSILQTALIEGFVR